MPTSRRQEILAALKSRCQAISVAAGFQTNAGSAVYLHEAPALGPDDAAVAIAIVVGDDNLKWMGAKILLSLPVEFQVLGSVEDLDDVASAIEAVLSDVKQAIELEDRTLDGLCAAFLERGATRTLPREDGSIAVGVGITYWVPYREVWGHPEL